MNTTSVRQRAWILIGASLAAMLALAGCGGIGSTTGGSGTSGIASTTATGGALVTITDAPGDFLSYLVNVVSLKLTRADGTVVEMVPTKTQVDFAQLVNLSEVVSAEQIQRGNYVAASLTVDYSSAAIVIDNGAGGLTVAANNIINGGTGTPLISPDSQITLSLQLPSNHPLVITPGTLANLALDFNLSASNTVAPAAIGATTAAASVTVTVNPVLTASLVPDATKRTRVRGTFVSVTQTSTNSSYTVNVRPFFNASGTQGQLVVNTTMATTFSINGTAYTGTAGLTALGALSVGTLVAASGTFDIPTKTFTANTVTVGGNGKGSGLDTVDGTVVARSGDVLTLRGGLIDRHDMDDGAEFRMQVAVTIAATTSVTEDGQAGAFGPQDISIGQHARFFGTLGSDASGNVTLDATQGSALLQTTPLLGLVNSSTSNSVTVTLQSLDGQGASLLDFAGTGSDSAQDATAGGYVIGVPPSLLTSPAAVGSPIKFFGFVAPFGAAPPDFTASALVSYANTAARLRLSWKRPGITAPFTLPLSAAHVAISQSALQGAARREIEVGPQELDPSTLSTGLSLVPDAAATDATFAIAHGSSYKIDTYSSFADLVAALTTDLNGTTALLMIEAKGPYDSTTGVLSVDRLVLLLDD